MNDKKYRFRRQPITGAMVLQVGCKTKRLNKDVILWKAHPWIECVYWRDATIREAMELEMSLEE